MVPIKFCLDELRKAQALLFGENPRKFACEEFVLAKYITLSQVQAMFLSSSTGSVFDKKQIISPKDVLRLECILVFKHYFRGMYSSVMTRIFFKIFSLLMLHLSNLCICYVLTSFMLINFKEEAGFIVIEDRIFQQIKFILDRPPSASALLIRRPFITL